MRISEIAARADTTVKAVRYYESLGLITPSRLANGYRDYSLDELRLVREIRELQQLGIPVERSKPFLECLAAGEDHGDDCPASLAAYRDVIDELNVRIAALAAKRDTLNVRLQLAASRAMNDDSPPEGAVHVVEDDLTRLPEDLPRPLDDGGADHLGGQQMPHLSLPSTDGEQIVLDELGPGRSVLYVYPLTGTPGTDLPEGWDTIPGARGCTSEACDFRDHYSELSVAGVDRVFGLSSQRSGYQRELVDRLRLPFAMLADPALKLAGLLGLPTFTAGGMSLYKRLTLIISGSAIEQVFYPIFPPNIHAQQVLAWLNKTDRSR